MLAFSVREEGTSRLGGEEPGGRDRTGRGSRTKHLGTQAISHEVIPEGLIANRRLNVFDAAPGTGTKTKSQHRSVCRVREGRAWGQFQGRLQWALWDRSR